MRGEKADGCWSFAPVDEGQMSRVTTPSCVRFDGSSMVSPVFVSTRSAQFVGWYFSALSSSPVVRSNV